MKYQIVSSGMVFAKFATREGRKICLRALQGTYPRADFGTEDIDYKPAVKDADVLERLQAIIGCVVRNCRHVDDTSPKEEPGPMCGPTWGKVAHICGLGSTSAIALCREYDVDPDYDCTREAAEAKGGNDAD